jgi:hypothetical protein
MPFGSHTKTRYRCYSLEITVLYRIPFLLELLHDSGHIHGIPHNDGVRYQIEATGLMCQMLSTGMPEVPLVRNDQGRP